MLSIRLSLKDEGLSFETSVHYLDDYNVRKLSNGNHVFHEDKDYYASALQPLLTGLKDVDRKKAVYYTVYAYC